MSRLKKITFLILLMVFSLGIGAGCAQTNVEDIFRFEARQLELTVGDEVDLQMILGDVDANERIVFKTNVSGIVELQGIFTTYTLNDTIFGEKSAMKIKAVKEGQIQLTAFLKSNPNYKDTIDINVSNQRIGQMTISGKSEMEIGDQQTLEVAVVPVGLSTDVVWSSSDESVATVDQNGVVTAIHGGDVYITAQSLYDSQMRGQKRISVAYVDPTGIRIVGNDMAEFNEMVQYSVVVTPEGANQNDVIWSVDNETNASITATGLFRGIVNNVDVKIIVTTGDGSRRAEKTVTIKRTALSYEIKPFEQDIFVGEATMVASIITSPADASRTSDNELVWRTDNNNILQFQENKLIPRAPGKVTITVRDVKYGYTAQMEVEVFERPEPAGVIIKETNDQDPITEVSIYPNSNKKLIGIVEPSQAIQTLEWSSSNEAVATVDSNGNINSLSVGTAIITAKAINGVETNITVNVVARPLPTDLIVSEEEGGTAVSSIKLYDGDTLQLFAALNPVDADQTVTWTSSNNAVFTVEDGLITAVAGGSATLSVASAGNHKTVTIQITVEERPKAQQVIVSLEEDGEAITAVSVAKGDYVTLYVKILPAGVIQEFTVEYDEEACDWDPTYGDLFILDSATGTTTTVTFVSGDGAARTTIEITIE